jgi:RNA polymerase sigma factor (sigma-70 family)
MSSRELSPEWVLSSFIPPIAAPQHEITELIAVARRLWPSVQAHAYREQPGKSSDEALDFASEVWEGVLRSVAKTIQRPKGRNWRIMNMEAYLFGAFHHRFNRALKKERRRLQTIQHFPTRPDLERFGQADDSKAVRDLEQSIQLREAVRNMDEWTRKVWAARQYGYSWKEIATQLGLTEHQVKLRFRYAIGKLRARLGGPT